MRIFSSLFGDKREISSAGIESVIRNFVHQKEIYKVLGEARTRRELGRDAESEASYNLALDMANRVCTVYGADDYRPFLLRAFVNLERGAEDDVLIDIQTVLASSRFVVDDQTSIILQGYEKKLQACSHSSTETPLTTVYICPCCGNLQHFATLPCIACNYISPDLGTFAQSLLLGSRYLRIGQLIYIGREIKAGKTAYHVMPNLREQARQMQQTLIGDAGSKFQTLLQDGANYEWIDTAAFLVCENCNNELELGPADSCMYCNAPTRRSDLEQRIITASRVKIGLEEKVFVSDESTYDRVVEGVVLTWSHMIQNQEKAIRSMARRVLDAFRQNGPLVWEGGGAIFDCSKAPEMEVYQIESDLDPQDAPFTELYGLNLQIFLNQLAESQ